jgi:membrane fusion protein, heavy metal efflux system
MNSMRLLPHPFAEGGGRGGAFEPPAASPQSGSGLQARARPAREGPQRCSGARPAPLPNPLPRGARGQFNLAVSAGLCFATTLALPAHAQSLDCMIQPNQVVQVGSPVPGVVERIAVERGDAVVRGQVLVQLGAGVERAALAVARERAGQVGEAVVASGSQELAKRELERANELFAQNFVSKTYLDKQQAEAKVAGGRSDQASERRKLSTREVDLAQAQLQQRTIHSPIGGVVVERLVAPGEYVDQKPVLRIASIDPLRVDVLVPAAAFGQVEAGRKASVVPELFNRSTHVAVVKSVDRVIDAASNTFRVRLELPNPTGALPAGLRCKVDLALKLPESARGTAAPAGDRATATTPTPTPGSAYAPAPQPVAAPPTPAVAPLPARTSNAGPAITATSALLQR